MIEANIKNLSRSELLYTCVAKMLLYIRKDNDNNLPEELSEMEHYCNPNDFNRLFYYNNSEQTVDFLPQILKDADTLLKYCGASYDSVTEYQLLVRCLSEQTIVENSTRRLRTKKDGGMGSGILQNPSDPDATYREKAGKRHRGYVANLEESVGGNGSVITDYQFEQNTYSDSQFLKDSMERQEHQEEESILVADGAYSGEDNTTAAAEKNVKLVTTTLTGRETPDIHADFKFNDSFTRVLSCPMGNEPKSCSCSQGLLRVSFPRSACEQCPHCRECRAKIHKRTATITISGKSYARANVKRNMNTEEFQNLSRIRNGIETVPSILRNVYNADRMNARGLIRSRFFFGCKVAALNVRKLFSFLNGTGHYAQNPLLA